VKDKYYIYYGGADRVVCVATIDKEEFVGEEIAISVC
jgi:predicted GH43/DUF377 family glycosyl hydrolase